MVTVAVADSVVAAVAVFIVLPFNFKVSAPVLDATPVTFTVPPIAILIGSGKGIYLGSDGGRLIRTLNCPAV